MSAIENLTAALEANTAIQQKILAALQRGQGTGPTTNAAGAAGAKAGAAAGAKAGAGKAAPKKKTVEDVAEAFTAYLKIKDADEREARKANVKAIVSHYGAAKATEIEPENFDEALGFLQQFIDGEDPFAGGEAGEGDLV